MKWILVGIFLLSAITINGYADEGTAQMDAAAPDFEVNNEQGKAVKLSDFKGKKTVVLAFYPKDFTKG